MTERFQAKLFKSGKAAAPCTPTMIPLFPGGLAYIPGPSPAGGLSQIHVLERRSHPIDFRTRQPDSLRLPAPGSCCLPYFAGDRVGLGGRQLEVSRQIVGELQGGGGRRSARRMSRRPQRSGAESPMAPKRGLSQEVWKGPGPSFSAGSNEKRGEWASHFSSYTKVAVSLPYGGGPTAVLRDEESVQVGVDVNFAVHINPGAGSAVSASTWNERSGCAREAALPPTRAQQHRALRPRGRQCDRSDPRRTGPSRNYDVHPRVTLFDLAQLGPADRSALGQDRHRNSPAPAGVAQVAAQLTQRSSHGNRQWSHCAVRLS